MNLDDVLLIRGRVRITLLDEAGELKLERLVENLVVTAGRNHIADQLSASPGQSAMSHMAIGTGTTGAAAGDTTLETELDRNALSSRTDATNVVTYAATWAPGDGTGSITEAGIFNNSSGGTMLARVTFTLVPKGAADTLNISWTVTLGT